MTNLTHNLLETYNYRGFVVFLYQEQYTKWWFYQFYYSRFSPPQELEWSLPCDYQEDAKETAELCIDEILSSFN